MMMKQETMPCPKAHGTMVAQSSNKTIVYRGVAVDYEAKHYRCPQCGIEAATVGQTSAMQKEIVDAYREKTPGSLIPYTDAARLTEV